MYVTCTNRFTFTHPSRASEDSCNLGFIYKSWMRVKPLWKCPNMDLEELLSSACRRKIIKYLAEKGSTNIMQLILGIRGKYPQINAELQILQKENIIIDQRSGRMRIIRLNKENVNTGIMLQALKLLNSGKTKKPKTFYPAMSYN
jgi:DNA-binding transcriptional ArsR family regulator